ncbi:MAG TPA: glycoside hydrolase family 6 protein [Polyangiaceae bacterium]|nr:glycoside hydrolase family 6 protein [Polyangiaceae bacterium]
MSRSFIRFSILSALLLPIAITISGCKKKSTGGGASAPSPTAASGSSGKQPFPDDAPITEPPTPRSAPANPLLGAKLFVDPESLAMLQANRFRASDPSKAALLDKIAQQPQGLWMGGWNSNIFRAVDHFVKRAKASGAVPVMIAYNVPNRDCGQYSQGGLSSKVEYQRWIRNVAAGIGSDAAVVVLEPDALGHFQECLSDQQKKERLELLNDAVRVLRQNPSAAVYLDAGHPRWQPAEEIAKRLTAAGVEHANGFSLNVSNYIGTEECLAYGHKVSELLGGKHFVIDTSRNGAGPYEQAKTEEEKWCNPPGRKIGQAPTTSTNDRLCDAFLWLKRPGESDGECNGGPRAGVFWLEQALPMAQ